MPLIGQTDTLRSRKPIAPSDCANETAPPVAHILSEMVGVNAERKAKMARLAGVHHVRFAVIRLDCAPPDCRLSPLRPGSALM